MYKKDRQPMHHKNQLFLPSHKHSIPNNYLLQFSYSNRNKTRRKASCLDGQEPTHPRYSLTHGHSTTESKGIPGTTGTQGTPQGKRPRENWFRLQTQPVEDEGQSEGQTGQAFPCRRVKTNQHQLFKILAKLQYHQSKRKRIEELSHRQPFLSQLDPRKDVRNHVKVKPKPNLHWVKERYCANRDQDRGMFPFAASGSSFPSQTMSRSLVSCSP